MTPKSSGFFLSRTFFLTATLLLLGVPPVETQERPAFGRDVGRPGAQNVWTFLSVIDIALDCGFSTSRYFASSFKRSTGPTPTAYRKRFKDAG